MIPLKCIRGPFRAVCSRLKVRNLDTMDTQIKTSKKSVALNSGQASPLAFVAPGSLMMLQNTSAGLRNWSQANTTRETGDSPGDCKGGEHQWKGQSPQKEAGEMPAVDLE
jgi:hypothetical protein